MVEEVKKKKRYCPTIRRERELEGVIKDMKKEFNILRDKYDTLSKSNELMDAELKRRGASLAKLESENMKLHAENERLVNRSFLDRVFNK